MHIKHNQDLYLNKSAQVYHQLRTKFIKYSIQEQTRGRDTFAINNSVVLIACCLCLRIGYSPIIPRVLQQWARWALRKFGHHPWGGYSLLLVLLWRQEKATSTSSLLLALCWVLLTQYNRLAMERKWLVHENTMGYLKNHWTKYRHVCAFWCILDAGSKYG